MKLPISVLVTLITVSSLNGCGTHDSGYLPSTDKRVLIGAPAGPALATINGEALAAPVLEAFARGHGFDPADPKQRGQALDQLIDNVLLAQDAQASSLARQPDVQAEMALARVLSLSNRQMADFRASAQVSEADLLDFYQKEVGRVGTTQFHLQHILFDEEAKAIEAAGRALRPDADFAALMGEYAAAGARKAGDLGWVNRVQLPPELAEAAQTLPDGQVAPVPVKTRFGWHVLKRVESRPLTPPPFEQVKEGARRQLIEQVVTDKVRALRESARIEKAAVPAAGQAQQQASQ